MPEHGARGALAEDVVEERAAWSALSARGLDTVQILGWMGLIFFLLVVATAVAAPILAPMNPIQQDLTLRFAPPVWAEGGTSARLLGSDQLGRDVLSRLIYGARVSLVVGIGSVFISSLVGTALGLVAGYGAGQGGRLGSLADRTVTSMTEIALSIPGVLLAIAVAAVLGTGVRNLIIILALFGWVVFARLTRGMLLALHRRAFVEAAIVLGASRMRVVLRHMLPHVVPQILVVAPLQVGFMILVESALSYLGLGVQPPTPTWGNMVAEARSYMAASPWPALFSGVAITFTVLSVSFIGDWARARLVTADT